MSGVCSGYAPNRLEPADSLDDYPTHPYAVRALLEHLEGRGVDFRRAVVEEPAANRGHIVRALCERFSRVLAGDVHDYGAGFAVRDYLTDQIEVRPDWVITNPPFNQLAEFLSVAVARARVGVAFFMRLNVISGRERFALYQRSPVHLVLPFAERVPLARGVLRDPRVEYFNEDKGRWQKPTTAADYAWFVVRRDMRFEGTRLDLIAPGAQRFIREGDYPADPRGLAFIEDREVLCA